MSAQHELLTPVRLADGREGVIVGRTTPTTASPAHYDVRLGTAIETPVPHAGLVAIGEPDWDALAGARKRGSGQ